MSKDPYKVFVEKMAVQNNASNDRLHWKWADDIDNLSKGIFLKVVAATTSSSLIYLHFRIIIIIYATNEYLFQIKYVEHDTGIYGKIATESIFPCVLAIS